MDTEESMSNNASEVAEQEMAEILETVAVVGMCSTAFAPMMSMSDINSATVALVAAMTAANIMEHKNSKTDEAVDDTDDRSIVECDLVTDSGSKYEKSRGDCDGSLFTDFWRKICGEEMDYCGCEYEGRGLREGRTFERTE